MAKEVVNGRLARGSNGSTHINEALDYEAARIDAINNRLHPGIFTVASPPANPTEGDIAYFSDGAAGTFVLAFFEGTLWLRCDTRGAITAV